MKREYLTNRITAPKFKVGKFSLNEYEARELVARIAEGSVNPEGIEMCDELGRLFTFDETGRINGNCSPFGWDFSAGRTMRQIKAIRKNQEA